jgi:hypothetical protein
MPASAAQRGWRSTLGLLAWCAAWLAFAAFARYGWVEHAELAARCDQGATDLTCALRSAVIQAFILNRLSLATWVLAVLAVAAAWRDVRGQTLLMLAALGAACCGLFWYSAQFVAPAALLVVTAWIRERPNIDNQPAGSAVAHSASINAP